MSLPEKVKKLEKMLAITPHNSLRAREINRQSRRVHEDVWKDLPETDYVSRKVLPLFARAL